MPSEQSFAEAIDANCGTKAPLTFTCSSQWEHSGTEVTYDPDDYGSARAVAVKFCGNEYREGGWQAFTGRDRVDPSVTWSGVDLAGRWLGAYQRTADDRPELVVRCHSNLGLDILLRTGGYLAAGARSDVITVTYSFGGEQVATEGWQEAISNEAAFVPRRNLGTFIQKLRNNSTAEFLIRLYQYDGDTYGTASFDLTGIELQVEPAFAECGW